MVRTQSFFNEKNTWVLKIMKFLSSAYELVAGCGVQTIEGLPDCSGKPAEGL
jgi:hypothetical protein